MVHLYYTTTHHIVIFFENIQTLENDRQKTKIPASVDAETGVIDGIDISYPLFGTINR